MAKVTKSMKNAIEKAKSTSYWHDMPAGIARNPFSGEAIELTAEENSLYTWTKGWYMRYCSDMPTQVPVSTYDNVRYYIAAINPTAYMTLLD